VTGRNNPGAAPTAGNIFNGNAVKGRQQFSLNLCNISKTPPFWLKTKWLCPTPLFTQPHSLPPLFFPGAKQDLKGRHFDNTAEVQRQLLAALDIISIEDFRRNVSSSGSGDGIAASSHRRRL
jgi:hypothetical protein